MQELNFAQSVMTKYGRLMENNYGELRDVYLQIITVSEKSDTFFYKFSGILFIPWSLDLYFSVKRKRYN